MSGECGGVDPSHMHRTAVGSGRQILPRSDPAADELLPVPPRIDAMTS